MFFLQYRPINSKKKSTVKLRASASPFPNGWVRKWHFIHFVCMGLWRSCRSNVEEGVLPSTMWFQGLNAGSWAWWQTAPSAEPSHNPRDSFRVRISPKIEPYCLSNWAEERAIPNTVTFLSALRYHSVGTKCIFVSTAFLMYFYFDSTN